MDDRNVKENHPQTFEENAIHSTPNSSFAFLKKLKNELKKTQQNGNRIIRNTSEKGKT